MLGVTIADAGVDFFAEGGGSLAAAQLVTALRERYPEVTVADLYDHPRLGALAAMLDDSTPQTEVEARDVAPTPRRRGHRAGGAVRTAHTLTGLQWATWLGVGNNVAASLTDVPWLISVNWWLLLVAFIVFITPLGRMAIAVAGCRILLAGVRPGRHPRGGGVHLRLWVAERLTEASGAANLAGAP